MSFERSTNERVLARHRFKRSRDGVAKRAVDQTSSSALEVVSQSLSFSPILTSTGVVTVFPPIGTGRLPITTTSPPISPTSVLGTNTGSLQAISTLSSSSSPSPPPQSQSSPPTSSITHTPSSVIPSSSPSTSVKATSSPSSMPTASRTASSVSPAQTDAVNSGSSAKSQSPSPGVVGGIVAGILVLVLVAFGFFARRRARHRRAVKRNTWGAGLVPALENKRNTLYAGQLFAGQSMAPSDPAPERHDNLALHLPMSETLRTVGIPGLAAPPSSYNPSSPVSPIVPRSLRGAPSLRSVAPSTHTGSSPATELAIVARTFIPSLPDELNIATGEQIRIINAYDDGWALCSNIQGEQGVVPLECLQRATSIPLEMQLQPQSQFGGSEPDKTSKRLSSFTPNTAGTY